MMKVWHFSEMAYHPAWEHLGDSYRVVIPSRLYDPKVGADLYHRYLDEWALCDELGINIMTNEHHATATCADSVCTIPMAILARETRKVRLLALGMPIANRENPIRVAEEYSMLDVISRGRIEMGFVKGVPFEIAPANSSPADLMERFWEAHDLILKAMQSHDGPFSWEGTHFHYRSVNVWPRPWQQPHPPVWMPVGSAGSAAEAAARGITIGVLNTGWVRTPAIFEAYRNKAAETGHSGAPDRLAYMALVGVGDTREEGYRRADQILGYSRTSGIVAPQFVNPPGYVAPEMAAQAIKSGGAGPARANRVQTKDGRPINARTMSVEDAIDAGLVFAGTPDDVFEQCRAFYDHVGGFGHLLMMAQGGHISHEDTVANLTLFSKEVLPRVAELGERPWPTTHR
ncbi:MAG: LLM class flavin-dependent oxidoreductase [Alphaproteobacteria bacterium]|nr:LLM class flavin-dependent oxidoreductase [Alphaproteobacteria bacterium]